jgi:glycosyltransferase involved in cell wall biosynthesis
MRIAVNTRLLMKGKLDGIGWFTYESFSRICRNHPEHEFHFFFDRPYDEQFIFSDNIKAHVIPPPARHPILFRIWYDYMVPLVLWKIKADIFISPDAMMSLTTNVPQIVVLHDLNFEHYPDDLPEIVSRYFRKNTPRFAKKAKRIVTVSEYSKQDIIRHYQVEPDKVDVAYNGVNESFGPVNAEVISAVRNKYSAGCPYFLFVSSIHPRKNLHRLLLAFDRFKKISGSDAKMVVVGKKFWLNEELDEVYHKMVYNKEVLFIGRLEAEALHQVVASALASVYVSYFEGFGIPIIEAFRCGVPVITSNVTAMPEVAGDAALLVNPFAVEEITQALMVVAEDEDLRLDLIQRGLQRAREFSWDRNAEAVWKSILKAMV